MFPEAVMTERVEGLLSAGLGWPSLPLDAWADTYGTLHRWTQVVRFCQRSRQT